MILFILFIANAEAVQKILERRKYVQAEDSESEDSDEDSGW